MNPIPPDDGKKMKHVNHGIDCNKEKHFGEGYLHGSEDDRPYEVDGLLYCGRCHVHMGWTPVGAISNVKTPPPLTPKDSLSVEVEEAQFSEGMEKEAKVIRARAWFTDETFGYDRWKADSFAMGKGTHDCYIVMKDELLETYHKVKTLEARLRRKDEALQFYADIRSWQPIALPGNRKTEVWITDLIKQDEGRVARAALAGGKEGGR